MTSEAGFCLVMRGQRTPTRRSKDIIIQDTSRIHIIPAAAMAAARIMAGLTVADMAVGAMAAAGTIDLPAA